MREIKSKMKVLFIVPAAIGLACTEPGASAAPEVAKQQGSVRVQIANLDSTGYEEIVLQQSIVRMKRGESPAKYVANGELAVVSKRHHVTTRGASTSGQVYLDREAHARKKMNLRFHSRARAGGHDIDLFSVDPRKGQNFRDPAGLLMTVDGRAARIIQPKYVDGSGTGRISGYTITDYDDRGKPRRLIRYDFKGFTVGCDLRHDKGSILRQVVSRVTEVLLPRNLGAQSTTPCIDETFTGMLQSVAWDVFVGMAGSPAVGEAAGAYGILSDIDCLFAIFTLPSLGAVTITCPPCPWVPDWVTVYNEITMQEESHDEGGYQCPADDSACTIS